MRVIKLILLAAVQIQFILYIVYLAPLRVIIAYCYLRTAFLEASDRLLFQSRRCTESLSRGMEGNNLCSVYRRKSRLWNNTATLETARVKRTWSRERSLCQLFTAERIVTTVDHIQVNLFFKPAL